MTEEVEKKIDGMEVANDEEEDDVNPWDVRAKDEKGIDYDKLISKNHKMEQNSVSTVLLQFDSFRAFRELQDRSDAARPYREGSGQASPPSPETRGILLPQGHAYDPQRR